MATALPSQPCVLRIPFTEIQLEVTPLQKKVAAVAIASILFFGIQFQLAWASVAVITGTLTLLTYVSEKYLRNGESQTDWFNFQFDAKSLFIFSAILLGKTLFVRIIYGALGIPVPVPQEGLVELIRSHPWKMGRIACLSAPFCEEILFRGFLVERFEDAMTLLNQLDWVQIPTDIQQSIADVAQAIIFGAIHLNGKIAEGMAMAVFLSTGLFGYLMARIKRSENYSLIPSITLHSANNTGALLHILTS